MKKRKTIIRAEKLCKSYDKGGYKADVLKDLNLCIYEEDFTVIMGRSGVGKSTLLFCLSSLDTVTSGKVSILDKDITKFAEKEKCELRITDTSFVFQAIHLLPDLTLMENITYIGYRSRRDKKKVKEEAEGLLKKFDIWEERDKYPSQVSGGQQQRAAVARALINHPNIIFGDEPTGALNSSATENVLDILTALHHEGKCIVLVTHDSKVAVRASRILYISDGVISAELNLEPYTKPEKEREAKVLEFLVQNEW